MENIWGGLLGERLSDVCGWHINEVVLVECRELSFYVLVSVVSMYGLDLMSRAALTRPSPGQR